MKDLKRLGSEEEFVDLYDHDEFNEILIESYKEDARAEGLEEGLAEGRAKGHAEGRAEGRAEGHAEGRAEGFAEGLKEKEEEIIAKLKKNGFSTEEIKKLLK